MASTRVRNSRRDRFRDGGGNPFREGRPLRVGSEIVVRSIDGAGSTIRALSPTCRIAPAPATPRLRASKPGSSAGWSGPCWRRRR